jgi:ATP-dependent exoDNAse (exonuclease V) beta subunit
LITERFQYVSLARESVAGQRLYATPDGRKLPSVTTILDRTKPAEKRQALENWRRRVGHDRAQQITTEAANRGTRMHSYLEHYVINGVHKDRGTNPFSWASHAMVEKVIQEGLGRVTEFWGTEVPLYFPQIYAGTTDCVGLHQGIESILDFKQTNRPKRTEWIEDYFLQLAAYAEAHNEVYGTQISRGVILMCARPEQDDQGNFVTEPQYQEWIVEGSEFEQWRQRWWTRVEQYYQDHA